MCKHDDNVSPYLRRRLRSYNEATRAGDAKTARPTDNERKVAPEPASDQAGGDNASETGKCIHRHDGEVWLP